MPVSHSLTPARPEPARAARSGPLQAGGSADIRAESREPIRMAGFFPGLGSRSAYRDLDRSLLDSGVPEVVATYRDAAGALGFPDTPGRLLLGPDSLPAGRLAREGLVGAALLVHSLVLDAHLRHRIKRSTTALGFVAYTGESFGVLAAAVAGGALRVADGVRIAHAFTPLMMLAAGPGEIDDADAELAHDLGRHLPPSVRGTPLVQEPFHVVGVRAPDPEGLAAALDGIRRAFPDSDAELHKTYSPRQANLYVRAGIKPEFDRLVAHTFPQVATEDLKEPTVFLAHSARMRPARQALEHFLDAHAIRFAAPRVPVVANHEARLLTTAPDLRGAVLAMADEVMASRDTCEVLDRLDTDLLVELGPGGKSVRLVQDNAVAAPIMSYTGGAEDTDTLLRAAAVADRLTAQLTELQPAHGRPGPSERHYDTLRDLFRLAAENRFCDDYLSHTLGRLFTAHLLRPDREGSPAFHQLLEVAQHTRNYREHICVDRGELVTRARVRMRIADDGPAAGRSCVELQVTDRAGRAEVRTADCDRPEVVVFHFDALRTVDQEELDRRIVLLLDARPTALQTHRQLVERLRLDGAGLPRPARGIIHQYLLFDALAMHRPALFAQSDHYLAGGDADGWLTALAVSGALDLAEAVALRAAGRQSRAVERILPGVTRARTPLVAPEGTPIQSRRDLQDATRAVLLGRSSLGTGPRRIRLSGACRLVSLGSRLDGSAVDAGPYDAKVVSIAHPAEAWKKRLNPALDEVEYACVLEATEENARVLETARSRNIPRSTVHAYIGADESLVGFGKGGSESLTVFVRKDGEDRVTVRKVLSEALTTARWDPDGGGVMLPPFAKAKKQAEFLQALPERVRHYFPEVYRITERELPVPDHLRSGVRTVDREVVYEMSHVAGQEVSRYVEQQAPPPAVVARLYEQIIRVLNEDVHSVGRIPAPGETLDVSYFRKIEDRLDLCRRTAPQTFNRHLLDTERIVVNGVSYLNSATLLQRFRNAPEFLRVLEPAFHALVMGDTNTENIKIGDTAPLLRAQRLIEADAPRALVDAALAAITAESLGIRFLDPRAIGFKSDGRETRDDPMYDNKPWHNSIGHYDEIHFEQFRLAVRAGAGRTPGVEIGFLEGNPYQRAYRVRDVVANGGTVAPGAPQGMEDYFAPVMTAALRLDDPDADFARQDPYWLVRFVFMMGQHFTAMPPFHFQKEVDGTLTDTYQHQRRPVAVYCEGIKWLNWALQMLEGSRTEFLDLAVPPLPHLKR